MILARLHSDEAYWSLERLRVLVGRKRYFAKLQEDFPHMPDAIRSDWWKSPRDDMRASLAALRQLRREGFELPLIRREAARWVRYIRELSRLPSDRHSWRTEAADFMDAAPLPRIRQKRVRADRRRVERAGAVSELC